MQLECDDATQAAAQDICNQMRHSVFSVCHQILDPQPFIDDCVFDYCLQKTLSVMQWPAMLVLVLMMDGNHLIGGGTTFMS